MAKRHVFLTMTMMKNRYIFHTFFGVMLNFSFADNTKLIFHATYVIVYCGKGDMLTIS